MTVPYLGGRALVVGVGDCAVARDDRLLVTYALGSCMGVVVHDPVARVGGMLHAMLPTATMVPGDAQLRPERYVDTGVPRLVRDCLALGAARERLVVKVAGGASSMIDDRFLIGRRNLAALREVLAREGLAVHAADTGGLLVSRTLVLHVATGDLWLRVSGAPHRML